VENFQQIILAALCPPSTIKGVNDYANRPDLQPKWSKRLYSLHDGCPPRFRSSVFWFGIAFAISLGAVIGIGFVSHKWPNSGIFFGWREFSISTQTAKTNLAEIKTMRDEAALAGKRIQEIDNRVANQRDTIDIAFKTASEAKRLSESASETLVNVTNAVDEARASLKAFREEADFHAKIRRASIGYAKDFDEICAMAGTSERGAEAFNAARAIYVAWSTYGKTFTPYGRLPANLDATTIQIPELKIVVKHIHVDRGQEVIFWVHQQARFSMEEKLKFLFPIAQTDPSLSLRAAAGHCYMNLVGIKDVSVISLAEVKEDFEKRFGKLSANNNAQKNSGPQ
jgi:hypothetical protein